MLRPKPTAITLTAADIEETTKRIRERHARAVQNPYVVPLSGNTVTQCKPASPSKEVAPGPSKSVEFKPAVGRHVDKVDSIVNRMHHVSIEEVDEGDGASESDEDKQFESDRQSEEDAHSERVTSSDVQEYPQDVSAHSAFETPIGEIGQENSDTAAMAVFIEDLTTQRILGNFQTEGNPGTGVMDDTPPRENRLHRHLRGAGTDSNGSNREN